GQTNSYLGLISCFDLWEFGVERRGDVMEEKAAAFHTVINAVQALGRGFDVNYDTRLLYCKGMTGSRVVEINEEHTRDLWLYDDVVLPNVSKDISNFQEPAI
ncbi:hypothetical protein HAX54_007618, partial [Datura stramonium]|nr:hypothetical protein [Datura stramonium]